MVDNDQSISDAGTGAASEQISVAPRAGLAGRLDTSTGYDSPTSGGAPRPISPLALGVGSPDTKADGVLTNEERTASVQDTPVLSEGRARVGSAASSGKRRKRAQTSEIQTIQLI